MDNIILIATVTRLTLTINPAEKQTLLVNLLSEYFQGIDDSTKKSKPIIMKKIFLLFSLFLMLSCSNSDNVNDSSASNSDFHPPAWIQGNWVQKDNFGNVFSTFSFYSNEFCLSVEPTKQCYSELVNQYKKQGLAVKVNETISATEYTVEIVYYAGQSIKYQFKKLTCLGHHWF